MIIMLIRMIVIEIKKGMKLSWGNIEGNWRELMGVAVVKIHCIHE